MDLPIRPAIRPRCLCWLFDWPRHSGCVVDEAGVHHVCAQSKCIAPAEPARYRAEGDGLHATIACDDDHCAGVDSRGNSPAGAAQSEHLESLASSRAGALARYSGAPGGLPTRIYELAAKAGYSREGAELLVRALRKKRPDETHEQKYIFVEGAIQRGEPFIESHWAWDELLAYARGIAMSPEFTRAWAATCSDSVVDRDGAHAGNVNPTAERS